MKFRVVFTEHARSDLFKASVWYEKQQKGLGSKFIDAVLFSSEVVAQAPLAYRSKYKTTREKRIKKFPFILIYTIEEDFVFVHAIFDGRKNPKKKYRSVS